MNTISPLNRLRLFAIGALALLVAAPAQAEIYKWVDANGKTHYTENKDEAGKGKAEQVKISAQAQPQSPSNQTGVPSARSWQDQEQESKQRLAKQQLAQASRPATSGYSQSGSYGRPTSDAGQCALARDIISGKAVHGNQAKTDANDRAVAASDIALFCK
ncbi:DUF4124 domain-containing protein [Undibacterium sp. Ren11W]|uniref:DUF4124 domain-containing protein n=1 Tax=Undibacterium sp. Ren11W TaxID=3413045 RepID=UPI003BF0E449